MKNVQFYILLALIFSCASSKDANKTQQASKTAVIAEWSQVGPLVFPENKYNLRNRNSIMGIGHIKAVYIYPNNKNHILIGAHGGGLWETINGGKNWHCLTINIPVLTVRKIDVVGNTIYAATGYNHSAARFSNISETQKYGLGVIKSSDQGKTWSWDANTLFNCVGFSVCKSNTNIIYACSTTNVYKSTNAGLTWFLQKELTKALYRYSILDGIEVNPTNSDKVFVSAFFSYGTKPINSTVLFKTTDGGKHWTKESLLFKTHFKDKELNLNTVGNGIKLYYDKIGNTLYASLLTNGYLKQRSKLFIFKTKDWTHWKLLNSTPSYGGSMLSNALLIANKLIYFGGIDLLKANVLNPVFKNISNRNIHLDIRDLKWHTGTLFIATDGGLFTTEDYGKTFTNLNGDLNVMQVYAMSYSTNETSKSITIGTQDDGFYRNDLDGTNWYNIEPWGEGAPYAHPTDKNIIFFKSNTKLLNFSKDGGKTISNLKNNKELVKTFEWENPVVFHPKEKETILTELKLKNTHGLFTSKDFGKTWQLIFKNKPNQRVVTMSYSRSKPSIIYFATVAYNFSKLPWQFISEMYISTNAGKTFKKISKGLEMIQSKARINEIFVDPKNPKNVWICFGNLIDHQKVYFTNNAGKSWVNISANLPNYPANRFAFYQATNTLFLGTDYGIYSYKNKKWIPFGTNFPKAIVSDMVIDQKTREFFVSTYGRGVWKSTIK